MAVGLDRYLTAAGVTLMLFLVLHGAGWLERRGIPKPRRASEQSVCAHMSGVRLLNVLANPENGLSYFNATPRK